MCVRVRVCVSVCQCVCVCVHVYMCVSMTIQNSNCGTRFVRRSNEAGWPQNVLCCPRREETYAY